MFALIIIYKQGTLTLFSSGADSTRSRFFARNIITVSAKMPRYSVCGDGLSRKDLAHKQQNELHSGLGLRRTHRTNLRNLDKYLKFANENRLRTTL